MNTTIIKFNALANTIPAHHRESSPFSYPIHELHQTFHNLNNNTAFSLQIHRHTYPLFYMLGKFLCLYKNHKSSSEYLKYAPTEHPNIPVPSHDESMVHQRKTTRIHELKPPVDLKTMDQFLITHAPQPKPPDESQLAKQINDRSVGILSSFFNVIIRDIIKLWPKTILTKAKSFTSNDRHAFWKRLFKCSANRHHFTDRLHGHTQMII